MRVKFMIGIVLMSIGAADMACAREANVPAKNQKFYSLHAARNLAQLNGKVPTPPARFFPLPPRGENALSLMKKEEKPSLGPAAKTEGASLSYEQAKQLLSLFASAER